MKKLLCLTSVLLAGLPIIAQAPAGIVVWKSADLKGYAATLGPKVNEQKVATQALANFGSYNAMAVHRTGSGEAEFHADWADFTVIQAGQGTLIMGGAVKDGKTTAAGEIRGPSIDGGKSYPVAPGDIINVPAKTPHQMTVPPGGSITYVVLKVPDKR